MQAYCIQPARHPDSAGPGHCQSKLGFIVIVRKPAPIGHSEQNFPYPASEHRNICCTLSYLLREAVLEEVEVEVALPLDVDCHDPARGGQG